MCLNPVALLYLRSGLSGLPIDSVVLGGDGTFSSHCSQCALEHHQEKAVLRQQTQSAVALAFDEAVGQSVLT